MTADTAVSCQAVAIRLYPEDRINRWLQKIAYCQRFIWPKTLKASLHMQFLMEFLYEMHLTLPYMNAFLAKHCVDWKESYHILFEDTLLSNFC